MKFVNEVHIKIVSCNYSPIIQPKFKKIQRKIVYFSASLFGLVVGSVETSYIVRLRLHNISRKLR